MRGLEAQGVPSKQAEAITTAITEVLNDSLENVAHSFVAKAEMQQVETSYSVHSDSCCSRCEYNFVFLLFGLDVYSFTES